MERQIAPYERSFPVTSNKSVTVFGAYGHTGRFVVSELRQRGWTPILSGRDPDKLNALGDVHPELDLRPARVDDSASLDRALVGSTAVINCAGPCNTWIVRARQALSLCLRWLSTVDSVICSRRWPWEIGRPQMRFASRMPSVAGNRLLGRGPRPRFRGNGEAGDELSSPTIECSSAPTMLRS